VNSSYKKMTNRIQLTGLFVFLAIIPLRVLSQTPAQTVLIETSKGNLKCILYEETPMHSENFVKLAREGFYDGLLFHRVVRDFMIQTGDPNSRNAQKGVALGYGDSGYRIPAEFHPDLYHRKGSLAAARQGDQVNPGRESNGSQFYIVQGRKFTDAELDAMEKSGAHIPFTADQRKIYRETGGAPHLDYAYTVFGEVVEGFETIDKIASVPTDSRDRPLDDVKIIRISVLK
jgi:cyclophilin family peptidyl-prolyl cis-trans isomerase